MKRIIPILVLAIFASLTQANELFVAQKDPAASDKNPGTEAKPLATIQAGVDKAQVGDTIFVKQGDYEEMIEIRKSGDTYRPTVLTAWKNDRVRVGYRPRPLPVAGKWEPVPGSKSWKVQLTKDVPDDFLVLVNPDHVVTYMQDTPVKDDMPIHAAYRKSDRTLMFNANGKDPSTLGTLEYGRRPSSYTFVKVEPPACGWTIRKMEFSFEGMGIYLCADNCVVEDCFFTHCYRGGIFLHARTDTVRRCCFYHCGGGIGGSGPGIAHLIEDNIIVECGQDAKDDIIIVDIPTAMVEGSSPTVFKGTMMGMNFLYNIVSDNNGAGWYADCSDSQSSRIVGNAFWDNAGGGIYNEASVADTIAQGNMFYRNGVSSSVCARWNVIDNLFFEGGVIWHNQDINPVRDTYNLLRGNAFINPKYGYLSDFSAGWGQTASPQCFRGCMVDHNRFWTTPDTMLINDGGEGKKYKSLDDVRKEFGWEIHGKIQPYDKDKDTVESVVESMGGSIVTFRIPWGKHSGEARPMLANTHVRATWPGAPVSADPGAVPTFFWRVADGNYDPNPLWRGYGPFAYHSVWLPGCGGDIETENTCGCRWYVDAESKFPDNFEDKTVCRKGHMQEWSMRAAYSIGKFWLVTEGLEPDKMLPQGVGYWSPCLGAAPGAKVTISLKMRGKGLVSSDKGSPAVWLQFTGETGQNRTRSFLVGKDDSGKMQRPELTKGDYDWTEVKDTVTAPDGAARMALFIGITPCKGKVDFCEINIRTASEAGAAGPVEILHPRLPLERIKQTMFVDLSKVVNRGLADEVDNDGKGGWTDQGPNADMRELKTGQRTLGGVTFNLLPEPKCVVALRSENRAKGDLPEKVTIPVGKKLDTLFFLHSAAWCPSGGNEAFRYVIHYKDGKDVTLPVTGNNLVDWIADPVARFPLEEGTFSTVADTVKNPQFRQGSVYRMEWSSPRERRGIEIDSIDFIGAGKAVPILLAITGVVEW
jgi:hypothetical protein